MQQVLNLHDSLQILQVGKCLFVVFTLMVFGMEKSTQYSSPSCDFTWSNLILNQLNKMFHQDTIICLFVKEIKRVWEAP